MWEEEIEEEAWSPMPLAQHSFDLQAIAFSAQVVTVAEDFEHLVKREHMIEIQLNGDGPILSTSRCPE